MVSEWVIKDGIANAHDVAFATTRHKIALKGKLNIADNSLDNLKLAVIDNRGCPIYTQQLAGSLAAPEIKSAGKLKPIIGPVINILKKPGALLTDKKCDVFYRGELLGSKQQ